MVNYIYKQNSQASFVTTAHVIKWFCVQSVWNYIIDHISIQVCLPKLKTNTENSYPI